MSGPTKKDRARQDGSLVTCRHDDCRATAKATLLGEDRKPVCLRHALFWERRGVSWSSWT